MRDPGTPRKSVHVRIEGRVQGVGFRAWTEMEATALGLTGWVRNRRDGAVEAVFHGEDDAVRAMLRLCHSGPPGAGVDIVEVLGEGVGVFDGFDVRPTV
jgi:acylphosphatase